MQSAVGTEARNGCCTMALVCLKMTWSMLDVVIGIPRNDFHHGYRGYSLHARRGTWLVGQRRSRGKTRLE